MLAAKLLLLMLLLSLAANTSTACASPCLVLQHSLEAVAQHQQQWQALALLVRARGRLGGLHAAQALVLSIHKTYKIQKSRSTSS
jgi:hypothetical protein